MPDRATTDDRNTPIELGDEIVEERAHFSIRTDLVGALGEFEQGSVEVEKQGRPLQDPNGRFR